MELSHALLTRRTSEPASHVPTARTLVKLGEGCWPGPAPAAREMRSTEPEARNRHRVATLLMTDIVGSTSTIARVGDARWADLLERHNDQARAGVERFGGRIVDFAGDRVFAVFQDPQCAIESATAIHELMHALRLNVRAGVHAGEVEVRDDQVIGLAVHIAARITACARQGETLVSRLVKDLLDDSDVRLVERGVYRLKGVPNRWPLFSVCSQEMLSVGSAAHAGSDRRPGGTARATGVAPQASARGGVAA